MHTIPSVHQCEVKGCMFEINKSIIKTFLTLNESSIHNIAFSSEKVILSESGEKYAHIKHSLLVKTVQSSSNMSLDFK